MEAINRWNRDGKIAYVCLVSWLLYYLLIPLLFTWTPWAGLLTAILVGPYVGIWAIYLMHECWHGYFSGINNRQAFVIFCCLLFTQPGAYGVGHRSHHRMVNTYEDLEIHPIGQIHGRKQRAAYNVGSFLFGSLFLLCFGLAQKGTDDSDEARYDVWMPLAWLIIWAGVAFASHRLTGAAWSTVATAFVCSIWSTSFIHRHNEMLEHGAVVGSGSLRFRASLTRNLAPHGWLAKLFLFIVHQDCRAHTLHHTRPNLNWRTSQPDAGGSMLPKTAVQISLSQYASVAGRLALGVEPSIAEERKFEKEQL